jgi:hypothetical protein
MEELIQALRELVQRAGLDCIRATPATAAPYLREPVAALSIGQADGTSAGFFDYLGTVDDDEHGTRALYGRRVDWTVTLTVLSPGEDGASAAEDAAAKVLAALSLDAGSLRVGACSMGACSYDGGADVFSCAVQAKISTMWYATAAEDDETLTGFELKGEWK